MLKLKSIALITLALAYPLHATEVVAQNEDVEEGVKHQKLRKPGIAGKVKGKISSSVKKEKSLTSVLFPGVTPEEYEPEELVSSNKFENSNLQLSYCNVMVQYVTANEYLTLPFIFVAINLCT